MKMPFHSLFPRVGGLVFLFVACTQEQSDVANSVRGCEWQGQVLAPGATVKVDCNTCSCGQDSVIHCTTIACVNPTPDRPDGAVLSVSAPQDSGPKGWGCALPTTLVFGFDGGRSLYTESYFLGLSGVLTVTRVRGGMLADAGTTSCSTNLPPCGATNAVSPLTLSTDLASADVQAAFDAPIDTVYGVDPRPWDGTILYIQRGDGKRVFVGQDCGAGANQQSTCLPIPAGLARLAQDLRALVAAKETDPACQAL